MIMDAVTAEIAYANYSFNHVLVHVNVDVDLVLYLDVCAAVRSRHDVVRADEGEASVATAAVGASGERRVAHVLAAA